MYLLYLTCGRVFRLAVSEIISQNGLSLLNNLLPLRRFLWRKGVFYTTLPNNDCPVSPFSQYSPVQFDKRPIMQSNVMSSPSKKQVFFCQSFQKYDHPISFHTVPGRS